MKTLSSSFLLLLLLFLLVVVVEIKSPYVVLDSLKLTEFYLSLPPEYWNQS